MTSLQPIGILVDLCVCGHVRIKNNEHEKGLEGSPVETPVTQAAEVLAPKSATTTTAADATPTRTIGLMSSTDSKGRDNRSSSNDVGGNLDTNGK